MSLLHRHSSRAVLVLGALLVGPLGCQQPVQPGQPLEQAQAPSSPAPAQVRAPGPQAGPENLDQGQQHPPLPADNPAWDFDAQGFVASPRWYGEKDWAGVRMRLAGHLYVSERDRARAQAEAGDYAAAAQTYQRLATDLAQISLPESGPPAQIRALLLQAARRDAALCGALAEGAPPPEGEGLAGLRARYLGLAQTLAAGPLSAPKRAEAEALLGELERYQQPKPGLELDDFANFVQRHELRVRLFSAALDAADPIGLQEPWGYWRSQELREQAGYLVTATHTLILGREAEGALGPNPLRWPSELSEAQPENPSFSAYSLGALPTGDSLIDVGGQPGPLAIGTLQRWGLDDPEHLALLEQQALRFNAELEQPRELLASLRALVQRLDAAPHGSRFYNVKQARNEGVRVLARAGHPELALELLEDNWPLHHQDWACPNRRGILLGLKARLQHEAKLDASPTWDAARLAALEFLALVDRAEAGEKVGVAPPQMGPTPTGRGPAPPGGRPAGPPHPRAPSR